MAMLQLFIAPLVAAALTLWAAWLALAAESRRRSSARARRRVLQRVGRRHALAQSARRPPRAAGARRRVRRRGRGLVGALTRGGAPAPRRWPSALVWVLGDLLPRLLAAVAPELTGPARRAAAATLAPFRPLLRLGRLGGQPGPRARRPSPHPSRRRRRARHAARRLLARRHHGRRGDDASHRHHRRGFVGRLARRSPPPCGARSTPGCWCTTAIPTPSPASSTPRTSWPPARRTTRRGRRSSAPPRSCPRASRSTASSAISSAGRATSRSWWTSSAAPRAWSRSRTSSSRSSARSRTSATPTRSRRSRSSADDQLRVEGGVALSELEGVLGHSFDREDVSTVGGLVLAEFGRVPRAGEAIDLDGYRLVVEQVIRRRVRRVAVYRPAGRGAARRRRSGRCRDLARRSRSGSWSRPSAPRPAPRSSP